MPMKALVLTEFLHELSRMVSNTGATPQIGFRDVLIRFNWERLKLALMGTGPLAARLSQARWIPLVAAPAALIRANLRYWLKPYPDTNRAFYGNTRS